MAESHAWSGRQDIVIAEEAIDENKVLDIVQLMIEGKGKAQIARELKLSSGSTTKATTLLIKAAESVLKLSCMEDLDLIKGKLLNQAEMVFQKSMSTVNAKSGIADHGSAIKALTLVAKLSGAFAPQQINVQHNVEHSLEQLSDEQLMCIAKGVVTLEQAMQPGFQLPPKATWIDAEYEVVKDGLGQAPPSKKNEPIQIKQDVRRPDRRNR